jgi:hypothetical protein
MEVRHTSLERGLTVSLALVVLVVVLIGPVTYFAMKGLTDRAQVLRDLVIRGQLAYAKVSSDADSLRATTLEAATNPDPEVAKQRLALAKTLVQQFPDDARKMIAIFCPPTHADQTPDCSGRTDEIGRLANAFDHSASAFDFQALSVVSLLEQGKTKAPRRRRIKNKPPTVPRCSRRSNVLPTTVSRN